MKYVSFRNFEENILLIYFKSNNKRSLSKMRVLVSTVSHSCPKCMYNPTCNPHNLNCSLKCHDIEEILELKEKMREMFIKGFGTIKITPLGIERVRTKSIEISSV